MMVRGEGKERVREHAAHSGHYILCSDFNLWLSIKPIGKSKKMYLKTVTQKHSSVKVVLETVLKYFS